MAEVDKEVANFEGQTLVDYLTAQNHEVAAYYNKQMIKFFYELLIEDCELSKMSFKTDPNL